MNDSIVFGIPTKYNDMVDHEVSIEHKKSTFHSLNYTESFAKKPNYSFEVAFDFEFNVNMYIYVFYSTMDMVSKLGGIGATLQIVLKIVAPIFVLKFMTSFALLIMRKAEQKIRILRLKDIVKYLDQLNEKVKQRMEQAI